MNVSCPTCTTIFRIDPVKVPFGGIRARCSECGGAIDVPDHQEAAEVMRTSEQQPSSPRSGGTGLGSGALRRSSIDAMSASDMAAAPEPDFRDDGPLTELAAPAGLTGGPPAALPRTALPPLPPTAPRPPIAR